jgi:hypothetical protein
LERAIFQTNGNLSITNLLLFITHAADSFVKTRSALAIEHFMFQDNGISIAMYALISFAWWRPLSLLSFRGVGLLFTVVYWRCPCAADSFLSNGVRGRII